MGAFKNMKSIKLMFLMILTIVSFTSCDSGAEQTGESIKQTTSINETARVVAYDTIGLKFTNDSLAIYDGDYVVDTWEKVDKTSPKYNDIVNIVENTGCSTCRLHCKAWKRLGNGSFLVSCDDGLNYHAVYAQGSWHLYGYPSYGTSDGYYGNGH